MTKLQKARREWLASGKRDWQGYFKAVREAEHELRMLRRARLGQGLMFLKPQAE
jgi:hypothetical protein